MTTETMHKILDLYDLARQDAEYMALTNNTSLRKPLSPTFGETFQLYNSRS